uniref:Mitochondrial uncoupling protein 1 n=1 Tax=Zea mays TaxID=4577 RepID=A0A804MJ41_MAIZE
MATSSSFTAVFFSSAFAACFAEVKAFFVGGAVVGDVSLLSKILAALTTGVIAIVVANPTDLVKVRLQADGKANTVKRSYSGALNAYATIIRQEGIGALWTGLGPNVARNAIINAAELASYDQFKQMFLKLPGFTDNVFTHLLAGLGAGFFAVCIGSPVDVVKSRMMGDSMYKSTLDCFAKTLKNDVRKMCIQLGHNLQQGILSWTLCFLQGIHCKLLSDWVMECDNVFNSGAG